MDRYTFLEKEKNKIEIDKEVLGDVSGNFDRVEPFIEQKIEEICERNNISVEEIIFLFVKNCVSNVITCC